MQAASQVLTSGVARLAAALAAAAAGSSALLSVCTGPPKIWSMVILSAAAPELMGESAGDSANGVWDPTAWAAGVSSGHSGSGGSAPGGGVSGEVSCHEQCKHSSCVLHVLVCRPQHQHVATQVQLTSAKVVAAST